MSSVVNRVTDFFSGLIARKQVEEQKKAVPFLDLVDRILAGEASPDEPRVLKILQDAGKSIEELEAEVTFRMKLQELENIVKAEPDLVAEKREAEASLKRTEEELEAIVEQYREMLASARDAISRRADLLARIDLAKAERRRLLLSRRSEVTATLQKEAAALSRQQAMIQAGLHTTQSSAELEAAAAAADRAVEQLEEEIARYREVNQVSNWQRGGPAQQLLADRARLARLREARDKAVERIQAPQFKGLQKVEARLAEIRAEVRALDSAELAIAATGPN